MTVYRSFAADFPLRCKDLLMILEEIAYARDREVTLLLALATAAFVIPYERLRPQDLNREEHPSADRQAFAEASHALDSLLGERFRRSRFHQHGPHPTPWRWVRLDPGLAGEQLKSAFNREWMPLKPTFKVRQFLNHIRNALAHGNIYVDGDQAIQQIILLSRPDITVDQYDALMCPPDAFRNFIVTWIDFLAGCPFPPEAMPVFTMPLPQLTELQGANLTHRS